MTTHVYQERSNIQVPRLENEEREQFILKHLENIEKGNPSAMNSLANYYAHGEQNYDEAIKYYKMAVDLKYSNSFVCLGDLYSKLEEYDKMIEVLENGITHGLTKCMLKLGNYYKEICDFDNMKKYLEMAFSHGENRGMYELALFYKYQLKDYNKMKKCFNKAVQKGDTNSMLSLGIYYEDQVRDYDLMKKYYMMAIEHGNDNAMFAMGNFYEETGNIEEAVELFNKGVVSNNNLNCLKGLVDYYKKQKNIDKLADTYKLMTLHKNPEAFYELVRYYLYGCETNEENLNKARDYLLDAYKLNYDINELERVKKYLLYKAKDYGNEFVELIIDEKPFIDNLLKDTSDKNGVEIFNQLRSLEDKIQYMKKQADKGSIEAMRILAVYYICNLEDFQTGFQYLNKIVEYKNTYADYDFGLEPNIFINKFEKYIEDYPESEYKSDAYLFLGLIYLSQSKISSGEKYLLSSAELKNVKAFCYLINIYSRFADDSEKKLNYIKLLVGLEHPYGYCKMGLKYYTDEDDDKCFDYLVRAIKKGYVNSLYYLGKYYYDSYEQNFNMMKRCMRLSIKYSDNEDAIKYLLNHYTYIEYDYIYSIRYQIMLMGKNSIISFNDVTNNPYYKDRDFIDCTYSIDEEENLIQRNMVTGEIKKFRFNDINHSYSIV